MTDTLFTAPCANMAYTPRSRIFFHGDLQHDFRDYQHDNRYPLIEKLVGEANIAYLCAAAILGAQDDPIAECLRDEARFYGVNFISMHDHLAAFWRKMILPASLAKTHLEESFPDGKTRATQSYAALHLNFANWLMAQVKIWATYSPHLIRQICLVQVRSLGKPKAEGETQLLVYVLQDYPI